MGVSQRLINFAASIAFVAALLLLCGCKGRTVDNMVPDNDTIEVVIAQPTVENDTLTN